MIKFLLTLIVAVLTSGCLTGGGGGAAAGSVTQLVSGGGSGVAGAVAGAASVLTFNNPEPSSLILLGVGIAGFIFSKALKNKR